MKGKQYPEEFKIEAVKQIVNRNHSVSWWQHVSVSALIVFTPR